MVIDIGNDNNAEQVAGRESMGQKFELKLSTDEINEASNVMTL